MPLGNRRQFLSSLAVGAGLLAGCSSDESPSDTPGDRSSTASRQFETVTRMTPTATGTPTAAEPGGTSSGDISFSPPSQEGTSLEGFEGANRGAGSAVALSSDCSTAVVGAMDDSNDEGEETGSAYVFRRSEGGWTKESRLLQPAAESLEKFGYAVDISSDGSTIVVSMPDDERENNRGVEVPSGSVYVFQRVDGSWEQTATLLPDRPTAGGHFGLSVSLSNDGTTAVVGADTYVGEQTRDEASGYVVGTAFVYERNGSEWTLQQTLTRDDDNERFGRAVDISADGSTILVGAPYNNAPNGLRSGACYVFERGGSGWAQQSMLVADDGSERDNFGKSVSLSADGTTAVVGAPDEADATYVFDAASGEWRQRAKLSSPRPEKTLNLGTSVSVSADGTVVVVGAPTREPIAFLYEFEQGETTSEMTLQPPTGGRTMYFGTSTDLCQNGNTVLIGAPGYGTAQYRTGAAYVFE